MFIFNLTYIKPISEVERILPNHVRFLDDYYRKVKFICSGRKSPRIGGIILCSCKTKEEAEAIMQEDPFYNEGIAQYEMIEFIPSKAADNFLALKEA